MAKKPAYPTKTCPKCSKLIHAAVKKHEDCSWVLDRQTPAAPMKHVKKGRKPGPKPAAGSITIQDIEAVKAVVDRMGAEKVRQLAQVLAK